MLFVGAANDLTMGCLLLQNYFGDPWNTLDFVIVVGSIVDITAEKLIVCILDYVPFNICITAEKLIICIFD